ncbi:MAG: PD-(D/E)XK nuclease family protein [Elusimicrobia bacterium]|nr:PD-(D/E)XK nuclease family protein [Elusimicrobiota bacterium]
MKGKNNGSSPEQGLFGDIATAPAARKDGLLFFSYSRMSLYEECPLKYKFKYIDKIKEEPKYYFAFGSSIHKALEFLYSVKAPPFPTAEEVCEAFRADWNLKSYLEKGYRTQAKADDDYQKGLAMLRAYYEHNRAVLKPPFLVEYSTDVAVDGLLVRAISDRIDHLGDGRMLVTDYKTGKDVRREPAQLYMYQKIMELDPGLKERIAENYGKRVAEVRIEKMLYYHVPSNKEYPFDRASDSEIGGFWERVLGVAENIKGLKFGATPGERQCKWCDYKHLCPEYCGGHPGRTESVPASSERIEALVDRYGRLKEKMDEIKAQLDEVAAGIARAAKSGGAYEGEAFTAQVTKSPKWEFRDREAVLGVLNQFDLYQRALNVTVAGISGLLDSPDISDEARQRLLEHAVKRTAVDIKVARKPGT